MKIQFVLFAAVMVIAFASVAYAEEERDLAVVPPVTNLDWNGDGKVDWKDDVIALDARRPAGRRVSGGRPVAVRADWNGDGVIDSRDGWRATADWNGDGRIDWKDDWAVRDGWRGGYDWNRDGIIDWKDDALVEGAWRGYGGDWVRADWNRDGVIDSRDGWRQLDGSWTTGAWDPNWRGEGWRPETVSVREVPANGLYHDSEWHTVNGWDLNGDGIVDGRRGGSWRADWDGDGIWDSWGYGEAPRTTTRRTGTTGTQRTTSRTAKTGTTSTTKPTSGTTSTQKTGTTSGTTKPASTSTTAPKTRR